MNIRTRKRSVGKKKIIQKPTVSDWCEEYLNMSPRSYQKDIINSKDKITLGHWGRRTGKSTTLCNIALYEAVANNKSVVVISPNPAMRKCISDNIRRITNQSSLSPITTNRERILFGNGSIREISVSNGLAVHGLSADVILLDELEMVSVDIMHQSVMPLLISSPNNKIVCLSSKHYESTNSFKGLVDADHKYSSIRTDNPETGVTLPDENLMSTGLFNLEYLNY